MSGQWEELIARLEVSSIAVAAILLPLPRLGLTPEVVARLALPGSGQWVEQPHRVLAFGFLYFAATAISEAFGHRWVPTRYIATPAERHDRAA